MAAAASTHAPMRAGSRATLVPRLSAARVPSLLLGPPREAVRRRPLFAAAAAAKKGKGSGTPAAPKKKQQQQPEGAKEQEDDDNVTLIPDGGDEDEGDDGFYNEGDDDTWFEEIGDEGDEEDDDGALLALLGGGGGDDDAALADPSKRVSAEGASWGAAALEAARRVLAEDPDLNGGAGSGGEEGQGEKEDADGADGGDGNAAPDVSLYAFRVLGGGQRIDVRLDSLRDRYGSPTMVQIEAFARAFGPALELAIGTDAAADVAIEVSSPGAERRLELPGDLRRFAALPLRVEYFCAAEEGGEEEGAAKAAAGGKRSLKTAILRILDDGSGPIAVAGEDEAEEEARPPRRGRKAAAEGGEGEEQAAADGATLWRLADVKANAPTKGRGLTRKQRDQRLRIPLADLVSVRIHVEF